MTLFEAMMEDCELMDLTSAPDGEGGFINKRTPGAPFKAAVKLDSSTLAKIAEKDGVESLYTITTGKGAVLKDGFVFRRKKDEDPHDAFMVTSDGTDNQAPDVSTLDLRQVSAKKWRIPDNEL